MSRIITRENFLSDFGSLTSYQGVFSEVENHDGAYYPAICMDVPRVIKQDLYRAIVDTVGFDITPRYTFLRRFEEGNVEPYQAHTDLNMGQFTCLVYKQGVGGTSFVRHRESGMDHNDMGLIESVWDVDKNNYDAWEVWCYQALRPNKAVIYDASLMHRGEPVQGYGKGSDARELLICFFDMSVLQRTQDPGEILEVLKHPAIWDNIGGNEFSGFELDLSEDYHYLHAPGAIFILHPEGDDWMIHANVVPEARADAFSMGQEALRYAFEYLGAEKVVAEIPEKYENVYQFSVKSGMRTDGLVNGEYKMSLEYGQWVR